MYFKPNPKIADLSKEYNNPVKLLEKLKTKPEKFWIGRGEEMALELFHMMAKRVPAYKNFLKKHDINPTKIKTVADFEKIPVINKDNYLREYPLADLCWDGNISHGWHVYSSTSGSTGEPFYFPRGNLQDKQYSVTAEMYLLNNFQIDKKTTLYVDGFAMGAWIGGLFTYQAVKNVAERGHYNLSIITPGINKQEIIKSILNLGPNYDQVILGGYPPFVKDVIDAGIEQGIKWSDYNLRIIFSAEAFSEKFRDYIAERIGLKNIYSLTLNHYGTVDQGTIAHETPLSVLIRRIAMRDSKIFESIFGQNMKVPTLAQYLPEMFYFEHDKGKIICSAFSGIPLVRYDLKDNGGIFTLADIKTKLKELGINLDKEIKEAKISETNMNLPFVFVYERADLSTTLYGLNVYPEHVKEVLVSHSEIKDRVTGKFTMLTKNDAKQNQYLEINVELKNGSKKDTNLKKTILKTVVENLINKNSEFRELYRNLGNRAKPKIIFWTCNHEKYFCLKGKQRWVIK
ncbi:MAG: hypothetical protein WCW56_01555 [Candidatus Paceibacterota bacterium]|jgi:phenylacetate-CoA ligase